MITREVFAICDPDTGQAIMHLTAYGNERWHAEKRPDDRRFTRPVPVCNCCGHISDVTTEWPNGQVRCAKHHDRNPCCIEGCTRTHAKNGSHRDDQFLCGEHWRALIPPRSRIRRAYHALYRRGTKLDWPADLEARWWQLWARIVRIARLRHERGRIDELEINRLMGWE